MNDEPRNEPELQWDGFAARSSYNDWVVELRDQIADAAKTGRWALLLAKLAEHADYVNAPRLGGTSLFTPLHQAAYLRAPLEVVDQLLALGAWRTLRNAKDERPVDVARRRAADAGLVARLQPILVNPLPLEILAAIRVHLHALIRQRAEAQVVEHCLRLPELEPLLEIRLGRRVWFSVPGMYGGFSYWLQHAGEQPKVMAESWCRVVGGSGERHAITAEGTTLIDSGFV